jgi:hypothetical protein
VRTLCLPNAIALSCESRPPRGAHCGTVAAATDESSEGAKCGRRAAVQFEPPEAARPPGQRSGGFCQLVRAVGQPVPRLLSYE